MADDMADPKKYFGSEAYYKGELLTDSYYERKDALILKSKSGIQMWSCAIDVRESKDPQQELPRRGLQEDRDVVLFHYTNEEGFQKITSLKSNEVRASKLIAQSVFGCGVYASSRAPHLWRSKAELLLNNYFPAKEQWKKRTDDIHKWPNRSLLHSDQKELTLEQASELLETDFGKDLLKEREGLGDFCIPIVCDKRKVEDIMIHDTDAVWMPENARKAGENQYGEQQPKWRDVWVVRLYQKEHLPGCLQLSLHNASQPPEMLVNVLEHRLDKCPHDSDLKQYLAKAKEEMKRGWFAYISSKKAETSILGLDKAFKTLCNLKEVLRESLVDFEIPCFLVVGKTSVGKSTVLQRISQLPFFPSDKTLCTQIPIKVEMRKPNGDDEPTARMSVMKWDPRTGEYSKSQECQEISIQDANDKVTKKMRELLEKAGLKKGQGMIMDMELRITVVSDTFPPLDLVDLPGIVTGSSETMAKNTKALFKRYAVRGVKRSLFVYVVAANSPAVEWHTKQMVCAEDSELRDIHTRSLGIMTKCDKDDADEATLEKWLRGRSDDPEWPKGMTLDLGQFAVAAPSASEEADRLETIFFEKFLPKEHFPNASGVTSISSVRRKIQEVYLQRFVYKQWWPVAMQKLLASWSCCAKALPERGNLQHMQLCDEAWEQLVKLYRDQHCPGHDLFSEQGLLDYLSQEWSDQTLPNGADGLCKTFISTWQARRAEEAEAKRKAIDLHRDILDASYAGNEVAVRYLLSEDSTRVDQRGYCGRTPLHQAALMGWVNVVELLLHAQASVAARNSDGRTPLDEARERKHQQVVNLLEQAVTSSVVDASYLGNLQAVEDLLRIDPSRVNDKGFGGLTPLHYAAMNNHENVVRLLLEKRSHVDATSADGRTPLDEAKKKGHTDVIAILEAAEANIVQRLMRRFLP